MILLLWMTAYCVQLSSMTANPPESVNTSPGLVNATYSQHGDIDIGAFVMVTTQDEAYPAGACATRINRPLFALQQTESIAFATDLVNRNPNILPNVTLGFILRGSCTSVGAAIANSLAFLPRNKEDNDSSSCSIQTADSRWRGHDVIGILGPGWSSLAQPVSSLYAVAKRPIVGSVETSDELSDKVKHPYFFRIVPPDVYQVQAILNFIVSNGWSYVSVFYADGAYGQNGFDNLQQRAPNYGVCIATSHRLLYSTDYDEVVSDLLLNSRARAVVLFMFGPSFQKILQAVVDKNATGHFIWIGAGSLTSYTGHQYEGMTFDPAVGTFIFELYSTYVSDFYDYLRKQRVPISKNPWMKPILEYLFDCSLDEGTCDPDIDVLQSSKYAPQKATPLMIDAVLTFAQAAHDLLSEKCPNARGNEARACITGELLHEYLAKTSFDGYLGRIKFDENQEVKGKYILSQFKYDFHTYSDLNTNATKRLLPKSVGIYDISSGTFNYFNDSVEWSHLNILERIFPWTNGSLQLDIPESVCSGPCNVGEYKIEKEQPCCWECRKCRSNERLVDGRTSCAACPEFMWPDPASAFTTCINIPLTYSTLPDTIPIALTSLTLFVLVIYVCVFIGYITYRNERVIKASSKELSVLQLVAILGGLSSILLFQVKPTDNTCSAIFFLFCMSFVVLYSPLLVKTIRIFRIFQSGKTNAQRLRFISPDSQLVIAGCFIAGQIALCVANYILFVPGARRTQPIWSEKYVELSCDFTLPGLASFLGYNIVLVSLCSVFAFKVRKLPDNFNESQFISMCVSTTLLIWLAFIPTYFTADREFVRVFLLSTALLLNHSVALILLFIPKIYTAVFLPPESRTGTSTKAT